MAAPKSLLQTVTILHNIELCICKYYAENFTTCTFVSIILQDHKVYLCHMTSPAFLYYAEMFFVTTCILCRILTSYYLEDPYNSCHPR